MSKAKRRVDELKGAFPFDSQSLVEAIVDLRSLEEGEKILLELQKELF